MGRYSPTEQAGVHAVGHIVTSQLRWIFREQPIADMGIDAHVERVDEEPTGQLIGLQIKTGMGNFRETVEGLVYRGTTTHLDYWLAHALPVILIAHLPETGMTYWVQVTAEAVRRTAKGWKILIPKANRFDGDASRKLKAAFHGTPRQQRLRRLALDEGLMRHIKAGGMVSVEVEDWCNKSLNRSPITVLVYDEEGNEAVALEWFFWFTSHDMKWFVETVFPWASARIDQEFYDENDEGVEPERDRLMDADDVDSGFVLRPVGGDEVYPYREIAGGEVFSYRLQLFLNDLGEAYLTVSDFLGDSSPIPLHPA